MSLLTIESVHYQYDKTTKNALQDISYEFQAGTTYGIVGKSCSGKTTLLSLIAGLDTASSGRIILNDVDISSINRDLYRAQKIGVIFQSYNLLSNATALENVLLSMNISQSKIKNKKQHALELLDRLGINEEKAHRKILKISGGEQQRVAIARVLSHDPQIILADEPTGNLDSDTEQEIIHILRNLAHQYQKCVIVVTHSKAVSKQMDEVLTIVNGELK